MTQRLRTLVASPLPDMALRLNSPAMHETVKMLAGKTRFDILVVEGLEMAPYMMTYLRQVPTRQRLRVIFDDHNAEYVLQKRAFLTDVRTPKRWHAALYSWIQWLKLRRYEAFVANQADHVIAVSEADRRSLERLHILTPTTIIPNGVDLKFYAGYHFDGNHTLTLPPESIVFTGKMDFRPNVDAVRWFIRWVWPRIRRAVPEAHFYVVGRNPHPSLIEQTQGPGVFVTGAVADVRPYIAQARVYVVPLRVGGGTRLKLLEAMAMKKAIVSTHLGAEGYPVRPGEHLWLADTPQEFARATIRLLHDGALRERLGEQALAFVRQGYDWNAIFPRLLRVLEQNS